MPSPKHIQSPKHNTITSYDQKSIDYDDAVEELEERILTQTPTVEMITPTLVSP